ncbi:MAG: hypothetical protein ACJATT_003205 [Myxococcota bacterium]|jgi:hypothetical protein
MDAELNEWKSLYEHQQMATQTLAELTRVRQRDQLRRVAEWVSATLILVGASVYLGSVSPSGMLVGAALLAFLALAGGHQWSVARGLERAMFAAPTDYARELAQRNAREIRRVSPIWPMFAAIGLATLVALDLVLGWSGERPSMVLAILVVTAECVVLAIGLWWRRRELTRLAQERLAISELCQALSGATG